MLYDTIGQPGDETTRPINFVHNINVFMIRKLYNFEFHIFSMKLLTETNKPKTRVRNIPTFLKKTYQILEDPLYVNVVRWGFDGVGFVVMDESAFERQVLPKYFKHSNYSSFVRQLNMYNFHKIREVENQNYFRHELFNRNNKNAIEEIKRKPEKKKKKMEYDSDGDSEIAIEHKKIYKSNKENHRAHKLRETSQIYLYEDNVKHQSEDEITKLGSAKHSTKEHVKTEQEFRMIQDDQASIQNEIQQMQERSPKMKTRQLIESGGTIFPLHTGLISIYSLASMMK